MLVASQTLDIQIIDSVDDNRVTFVIVNGCKVAILKAKIKDMCYVLKLVGNICHVDIDTNDCEVTK